MIQSSVAEVQVYALQQSAAVLQYQRQFEDVLRACDGVALSSDCNRCANRKDLTRKLIWCATCSIPGHLRAPVYCASVDATYSIGNVARSNSSCSQNFKHWINILEIFKE